MKLSLHISGPLEEVDAFLKAIKTHLETPGANGCNVSVQVDITEQEARFDGKALAMTFQVRPRRYGLAGDTDLPVDPDQPVERFDQLDEMVIEELMLDVRPMFCLKRAGIRTVADLVSKTEVDLLSIPNFGKHSLANVKDALAERGLELRQE